MEECRSPYGGVILGPDGKPQPCRKPEKDEIEPLAAVMADAWEHKEYKLRLLTFPFGQATDFYWYEKGERKAMLKRTRDALGKHAVPLNSKELPVVLSNMQFERGVYRMSDWKERVLRLPDMPSNLVHVLKNTSFLAYVIDMHICGM